MGDLEKRVEELEKRMTVLEEKHLCGYKQIVVPVKVEDGELLASMARAATKAKSRVQDQKCQSLSV